MPIAQVVRNTRSDILFVPLVRAYPGSSHLAELREDQVGFLFLAWFAVLDGEWVGRSEDRSGCRRETVGDLNYWNTKHLGKGKKEVI